MDISTMSLTTFITLAEQLHFGRTAERLGVSQPAVSRHIRQVEHYAGVPLVARTSRTVELTEAGRVFVTHAERALASLTRGQAASRRVAAGKVGVVRLGFRHGLWLLPDIVRAQRTEMRDATLLLVEADEDDQFRELVEHRLDVALTRRPATHASLVSRVLEREPLSVVVPHDHWAANRDQIDLEEVAGESFVMFRREHYRFVYERILSMCEDTGFSPRIAIEVDSPETAVAVVAGGEGIAVMSRGYARSHLTSVGSAEIAHQFIELYMTTRADTSELVISFADLLTRLPVEGFRDLEQHKTS